MTEQHATTLRDTVLTLAGIVFLLAAARQSVAIVDPFLLALFIAVIAVTPVNWLKKRGVPSTLAVGLVLLAVVLLLVLTSLMIGSSMAQFSQALPGYQERIAELTEQVVSFLLTKGIDIRDAGILKAVDPGVVLNFANSLFSGVADILSNSALIMFTTMFMLFDAMAFPAKFVAVEGSNTEKTLQQIARIVKSTNEYTVIKAAVSLLTGIVIWLGLTLIGLDFAVLWGVIAFGLNFVPNIGSILAAVPAILLGLIQLGASKTLIIIGLYLGVNIIMGNVLEPRIMGKKLGLSTLAVFLSLVFWGWLLGPVGMLLSVPLTMVVKLASMNNPQTIWFAVLLSPAPEEEKKK
ncbi:MAG: AI-2E family transporter [Thermodesulfobacteriota bacterium]